MLQMSKKGQINIQSQELDGLMQKLDQGLEDVKSGRVYDVDEAFEFIRREIERKKSSKECFE